VIWDGSKGESYGKQGDSETRSFGKNRRSCKYLGLKNHRFCFDIQHILFIVLDVFTTKHGIVLYFDSCLQ
jgi:hypothetical protein